jgi:hypothetical protein
VVWGREENDCRACFAAWNAWKSPSLEGQAALKARHTEKRAFHALVTSNDVFYHVADISTLNPCWLSQWSDTMISVDRGE